MSYVYFLAISCLIASCASHRIASTEGRKACLNKIATELPLATQIEKQRAYRKCLSTIDSSLAQQKLQEQAAQIAEDKAEQEAERLRTLGQASLDEKMSYCMLRRDEIIDLDNQRVRAYAEIMGSRYKESGAEDSRIEAERRYSKIINELDVLIPNRMRAGMPLVPDAISVFKSCNRETFAQEQ